MARPILWQCSFFLRSRNGPWKGESIGYWEQQRSWILCAREHMAISSRQWQWVDQIVGVSCVADCKAELCGANDSNVQGVITTSEMQPTNRKEKLINERRGMKPFGRLFLQWQIMDGLPWATTDIHNRTSISKEPHIIEKSKLKYFFFIIFNNNACLN